jgi:acyl-coenzyme A thioesterase PaaI-like protein
VLEKHCNQTGAIHGGMLAALVDMALGTAVPLLYDPPRRVFTVNLTVDFAGKARVGDWLEVHVDVQKRGNRLSFANCYVHLGEKRIVRASAVFATAGAGTPTSE